MRIRQIQIKNYRAFHGDKLSIDLPLGENLVVFGENGSGKSSIFHALKDFFNQTRLKTDIAAHPYRNFFAETLDDAIKTKKQDHLDEAEARLAAAQADGDHANIKSLETTVGKARIANNKSNNYSETSVAIKFLADDATRVNPSTNRQRKTDYVWTNVRNADGSSKSTVGEIANQGLTVTSGFIDYKGLLKTYFLQPEFGDVNIFEFLIEQVFEDLYTLTTSHTFKQLFLDVKNKLNELNRAQQIAREAANAEEMNQRLEAQDQATEDLEKAIAHFNLELQLYLEAIQPEANEMLAKFDENLKIELLPQKVSSYEDENTLKYRLRGLAVDVRTTFYGQTQEFHHQFLNEARLSAVAVSIYLASFLVNPQAGIKILVLDDMLIGLDMANRFPILEILRAKFADYQIFVLTFDKFWYEVLKSRFPDWSHQELITMPNSESQTFCLRYPTVFLEQAKKQKELENYFNAANLLRSYYEQIIRKFCDNQQIAVRYSLEEKDERASHFFTAIETAPKRPPDDVLNRTKTVVNNILNALSHGKTTPITRGEIETALTVIEELEQEFNKIKQ